MILIGGAAFDVFRPVIISGDQKADFGKGSLGFVFAKSEAGWGVLRTKTSRVGTGSLDIDLYCHETVYFDLLDDSLRPKLKHPLKLTGRKCNAENSYRYNLLAIENGFAIPYVEDNTLRLALFDSKSAKLIDQKPLLSSGADALLSADSPDHPIAAFYRDGKIIVAQSRDAAIRILAGRPGEEAIEIRRMALATRTFRPKFHGDFMQPALVAWTQQRKSGERETLEAVWASLGDHEIRSQGILHAIKNNDRDNIDLAVLRHQQGHSILLHMGSEVWRQRFSPAGDSLGEPERLIQENVGIYNFNAAGLNDDCLILYTVGNVDLKSYSCRTKQIRSLGRHAAVSMDCVGGRCLYSAGSVVYGLSPLDSE